MKRKTLFIIVAALVLSAALIYIVQGLTAKEPESNIIDVLYIQGELVTDVVPGDYDYVSSDHIVKFLTEANKNNSVKAVVLRINSDGGTLAAAQEIVFAMKKFRKPIVVSIGDEASSAAYYVSAYANKIIAAPDSITGSIGVMWIFQNKSEYYRSSGIVYYVIKSGDFKDFTGDWRGLTNEERTYIEQDINETHNRFVEGVAEGRNLSIESVRKISDGRYYSAVRARELGLIDGFGNLQDAIDLAINMTGTKNPVVVYMNVPIEKQEVRLLKN